MKVFDFFRRKREGVCETGSLFHEIRCGGMNADTIRATKVQGVYRGTGGFDGSSTSTNSSRGGEIESMAKKGMDEI